MRTSFAALASSLALSALAPATTIAHWNFNDLNDSSVNGHNLTNTNGSDTTINGGIATFSGGGTGLLSAPDNAAWDDISFTIESVFTFTPPSTAGAISTIAAHLSNTTGRQWLFGVNPNSIPYLLVREQGANDEQSFASSFGALTEGHTYYFGAAIDLTASDPANRVTLYFKDITNSGALITNNFSTSITALQGSSAPLSIGSTGHSSSRFKGSIDEVRFSDTKLGAGDLLVVPEPSSALLSFFTVSLLGLRRKRA